MTESIYIKVAKVAGRDISCDVNSAIILFIYEYLKCSKTLGPLLNIVIDEVDIKETVIVNISDFEITSIFAHELGQPFNECSLPIFYESTKKYCTAGFCAVLRQLVKSFEEDRSLLAFREACLSSSAECSVWTKFCEIDLINSIKNCLDEPHLELPSDVIRLEYHFSQPVRTHNIRKASARFPSVNGVPNHTYVEGPEMSLPDLIIYPLIHFFFLSYDRKTVSQLVPLVDKWYQLMSSDIRVLNSLKIFTKLYSKRIRGEFTVPVVKKESLYKCDPRRYKASDKIFTRQEDVDHAVSMIESMGILKEYDYKHCFTDVFKWNDVPFYAQPKAGNLPLERLDRKSEQIENIVNAVIKIAEDGDTIVDFCSGTGHVGILIACLLPKCQVLLIDNKEQSLRRANERVEELEIDNVTVIQSNVNYFKGKFQMGVTLHACGIATDFVIKLCILNRSKFVVSPCCYGKLQTNHVLTYPRSERLASSELTIRDYMVMGHSADQTHRDLYEKSDQGEKCMKIIDIDRCIHAEENDYHVYLTKMSPTTCSPKNNLLVGVPKEKFKKNYFER